MEVFFEITQMKIQLNGNEQEIEDKASLEACIQRFCPQTNNLVAEINTDIIKKEEWNSRILKEGDQVELIGFVGGG